MKFVHTSNTPIVPDALASISPRKNNILELVVTKKITKTDVAKLKPVLRPDLILLTEKLAADAKSGTLKGLGGFAEYEKNYILGLEGSYMEDPESALAPVKILERRIMDQIISQDPHHKD